MSDVCPTAKTVADALDATFSALDLVFLHPECRLLLVPPYPDAWSIAQHLEHVSLANRFLLLTISKGCRKALQRAETQLPSDTDSDLAPLSPIAAPGAFDWPPPRHMLPSGAVSLPLLRDALAEQHRACRDLLSSMPRGEGRLCTIRMSVHALGRLDMYQWLYFLAQHARYHLALIEPRIGPLP